MERIVTKETRMSKVKIDTGGRTVEAKRVGFKPLEEVWNVYQLEDGTILKIRLILSEVFQLTDHDPMTGMPQLLVKSTNVIAVQPATPTTDVH